MNTRCEPSRLKAGEEDTMNEARLTLPARNARTLLDGIGLLDALHELISADEANAMHEESWSLSPERMRTLSLIVNEAVDAFQLLDLARVRDFVDDEIRAGMPKRIAS